MADSGLSRGGANLLFGVIFAYNCMKNKKKLNRQGREGRAPPRSAAGFLPRKRLLQNQFMCIFSTCYMYR